MSSVAVATSFQCAAHSSAVEPSSARWFASAFCPTSDAHRLPVLVLRRVHQAGNAVGADAGEK